MVIVTLEARPSRAVVLQSMQSVIVSRQPPGRACLGLSGSSLAGGLTPRKFTLDLDKTPSRLEAKSASEEDNFPFTISLTDVEQFRVGIKGTREVVFCYFEIDWTCDGADGRTVIDDRGNPFEIYPSIDLSSSLHWGCGKRHKFGCPAERLAAQSSQGEVKSFDYATGAGYIRPDGGGADIYFHKAAVEAGDIRILRSRDGVTYEIERTRFEPHATRVRILRAR